MEIFKMPKIKIIRSAAKRFKKTSKSFKYKHANMRHILTKKSNKRKRHLRNINTLSKTNLKLVSKCIPYK